MALNKNIRKVMVIGSGPIVIGQAAEFDYAGNQACRALKSQGLEVVLVNSNPATLMTDPHMADEIYIEPLTLKTVERIIEKEKPDSLLSTLGGQTGLTLSMELARSGFLKTHNVKLLGANLETIDKAENRQMFKNAMLKIGEPVVPSKVVTNYEDAVKFVREEIGLPAIIRPAFTLGGTGGGICQTQDELDEIVKNGLRRSPIGQILVEKCISGWKEIEFEVMRDSAGNAITVCSMENVDPVGVHTGDSIVVAPTLTLADKEYQTLRSAALNIINELKIEGGCNCQFALNPDSFEYAVIEVNPRVSRSSALASKATGYPIAKAAALIAVGFTLDEIPNFVTKKTKACFEPVLDYVVVKMPRFPFDKFVYAKRDLGTQMKATGEVMAIGQSFEEALLKAARGAELKTNSLSLKVFAKADDEKIVENVKRCADQRIFAIYEALKRKLLSVEQISDITKIDKFFLRKIEKIIETENSSIFRDCEKPLIFAPNSFKMVDTCAGEFEALTPYFYSAANGENEAEKYLRDVSMQNNSGGKKSKGTIVVLGSGPIRIGQGIEFDYACVQCVWALKKLGYETAIINNNPETVSTDFDTADRLYFEPLSEIDVMNVIRAENPIGVAAAFGGQTAINLAKYLDSQGIRILGSSADSIDLAENRERFEKLCENLGIKRPKGVAIFTEAEALEAAARLEYPVLLRPSYILGGQNMIIANSSADVKEYMAIILRQKIENPVLIDKYMQGIELEVDGICDGEDVLIPGIMRHLERTGIHSGDSIAVYPDWDIGELLKEKIIKQTRKLALGLKIKGLVNVQYLIYKNELYIIEANPRSSRTVPYISKVTGVPVVELAVRAMLGEKLRDMGFGTGLYKQSSHFAVKVPVFSFEKLADADTALGPEMKSTGEVLGIAKTKEEALFKGMCGAGIKIIRPKKRDEKNQKNDAKNPEKSLGEKNDNIGENNGYIGNRGDNNGAKNNGDERCGGKDGGGENENGVAKSEISENRETAKKSEKSECGNCPDGILFSVKSADLPELPAVAKKFYELGFTLYGTDGNARTISNSGLPVIRANKIHENPADNIITLLDSGKIAYALSTSAKGRNPDAESVKFRRRAVEKGIDCFTALDTANALADCLKTDWTLENLSLVDIKKLF